MVTTAYPEALCECIQIHGYARHENRVRIAIGARELIVGVRSVGSKVVEVKG